MSNTDNKISIGFTGDFSFSGYFDGCYKNENLIDAEVLSFLNSNDANVINFESAITPCRVTDKKRLAHRSDPESLDYVKGRINNPVLSLANNHMMDYSYIGLIDTLDNIENEEITYIGAGRHLKDAAKYIIVGTDSIKIGIWAVQFNKEKRATNRVCGTLHEGHIDAIKSTISEMKKITDKVIVVYHGGDEFFHTPMPYVKKRLKKYLDMGCDIVVAHHPHVVQGYEKVGDKYIFYSLGNFMFDTDYQRTQEDTDGGILLRLTFSEDGMEFEHLPVKIDRETHTVHKGEDDGYFRDITKDYGKSWSKEAARYKGILARRNTYLSIQQKQEKASPSGVYSLAKKVVRKIIRKENCRKFVIACGSLKAKFYR